MGLFGKDDPITAWRKELTAALKDGDVEHLKFLLKREIDAPPEVLDDVLAKAVAGNQVKMATAILNAGGTRTLSHRTLNRVVYKGQTDMYRLLVDKGWDFVRSAPNDEYTEQYLKLEKLMAKEYEVEKLQAELKAVKKELLDLKKAYGLPENDAAARPATTRVLPRKIDP